MKKDPVNVIPLDRLQLNDGQLPWLPRNPRTWTQTDIDRTKASLDEDADFMQDRPILATPGDDFTLIAFAGNLRLTAARALGWPGAPVVVYHPEDQIDRETIMRRALKDNGSFGSWDTDSLANEWNAEPWQLEAWGVPDWVTGGAAKGMGVDGALSSEGREGEEGYDEFVDKFKQKLTTDDCYTPPKVYDAVLAFVGKLVDLKGKKVERPFVPGGDFEAYRYADNSIVVDNPPFSILARICRFYSERRIPFFIFAPSLTLFTATDCDLTYIVTDTDIEYENGARVRTGYITNLIPDLRIWCCPELGEMLEAAQATEDKTKQGFVYPDNIVTSAILQKIVKRGIELKIRKVSCEAIKESDSAKEQGRGLYGGGYIMSDRAAAERAAAERAAATRLNLSPREKAIIERLNEAEKIAPNAN